MPINPTTLKALIDTQITNETVNFAITPAEVGGRIKDAIDYTTEQITGVGVTPDATISVKGKIQLAGDLAGTANSPTVPSLVNKEDLSNKSTNVTTDGLSDTKYPSVKAVKTYVDDNTVSLTQNIITAQNNYDNTLTGYFNAVVSVSSTDRVVLPEGLLNGSTLLIRPVGLNASFKISGTITNPQQIHTLNQTSWFTEYQVEGKNQMYRLTKFDDNQWFIEIIKDNSLVINGITPVSEGTLRLCDVDFSATPLTSTQLQSIFGNNLLYPIGYKYYQPNATGGPIVFTKLAPDYWAKQTCTIAT